MPRVQRGRCNPAQRFCCAPPLRRRIRSGLRLRWRSAASTQWMHPCPAVRRRARDGSMSLMVACADAVFARTESLLDALSYKVFRISQRPGDGARTKLVNNLLAGINLVGAAEVLALAERMGLDLTTTLNVIAQSSGQSWIGFDRMRRAVEGDFAPRAHVTLLEKDTRLAVEAARAVGSAARWAHVQRMSSRKPMPPVLPARMTRPFSNLLRATLPDLRAERQEPPPVQGAATSQWAHGRLPTIRG